MYILFSSWNRKKKLKYYAFTNLSIIIFKRSNLQYYNINKQIKLVDNYENLALKTRNRLEDLQNYFINFLKFDYLDLEISNPKKLKLNLTKRIKISCNIEHLEN